MGAIGWDVIWYYETDEVLSVNMCECEYLIVRVMSDDTDIYLMKLGIGIQLFFYLLTNNIYP